MRLETRHHDGVRAGEPTKPDLTGNGEAGSAAHRRTKGADPHAIRQLIGQLAVGQLRENLHRQGEIERNDVVKCQHRHMVQLHGAIISNYDLQTVVRGQAGRRQSTP